MYIFQFVKNTKKIKGINLYTNLYLNIKEIILPINALNFVLLLLIEYLLGLICAKNFRLYSSPLFLESPTRLYICC